MKTRFLSRMSLVIAATVALAAGALASATQAVERTVQHVQQRAAHHWFMFTELTVPLAFERATAHLRMYVFQSTIARELGIGVIGEYFLDGATRAQPGVLKGTAANLVVGRWFTIDPADGTFVPGGAAGVPGGILANPKTYASPGTVAGGALAPTLTLLAGTVGEFVTSTPGIIVALANAAPVGSGVFYDDVTGALSAGVAGAGQTQIERAMVVRYANLAAGLAVVSLIGN